MNIPTEEEEIAHPVYNNYFPEGIDTDYLAGELSEELEQ
jgi:hypothetical protein